MAKGVPSIMSADVFPLKTSSSEEIYRWKVTLSTFALSLGLFSFPLCLKARGEPVGGKRYWNIQPPFIELWLISRQWSGLDSFPRTHTRWVFFDAFLKCPYRFRGYCPGYTPETGLGTWEKTIVRCKVDRQGDNSWKEVALGGLQGFAETQMLF